MRPAWVATDFTMKIPRAYVDKAMAVLLGHVNIAFQRGLKFLYVHGLTLRLTLNPSVSLPIRNDG